MKQIILVREALKPDGSQQPQITALTMNVYVVDDEPDLRTTLSVMLRRMGHEVQCFSSGEAFLSVTDDLSRGCVLLDLCLSGVDGLEVQRELVGRKAQHAVVLLTGFGDVPDAVAAMRAGALDFLRKPFRRAELSEALERAETFLNDQKAAATRTKRDAKLDRLSRREVDVLLASASGAPSKSVAHALELSIRTIEMHRANILKKLEVANFGAALLLAQKSGLFEAR